MKFCIFTDLHYDRMPDKDQRLQKLLQDCQEKQVELILELGDLCHAKEENKCVLEQISALGIPCYFCLGNHDVGICEKETTLKFLGLQNSYYSVKWKNIKFIFLDANHKKFLRNALPGSKKIIHDKVDPYISFDQIQWLKEEISDDRFYYVICSHHSLANDFVTSDGKGRGIVNRKEVRTILEQRNAVRKRVLICFHGHDHGSDVKNINGIYYYTLNSASYFWQNVKDIDSYPAEIYEKYPWIKNMVLYREPLHSIVTIDLDGNICIEGMEGHYLTVGPEEIGMSSPRWNGVSVLPRTPSLEISNV